MRPTAWLLAGLVGVLATAPAGAFERIGMVLLHGKTGQPNQFAAIVRMLDEVGYPVEAPEMCWSSRRIYDLPLADCMADVDAAIGRLKADGFDQVVIGGHSLGGLVALAYAATHDGLAGVALLAPDGEPQDFNRAPAVARSVATARQLIDQGKGNNVTTFTDRVAGRQLAVKATPRAFLSFLGSDSPLQPNGLVPEVTAPVFWAAGTHDSSQRNAQELFGQAPANPHNTFVEVKADHFGTPDAALFPLLDWLDRLAGD